MKRVFITGAGRGLGLEFVQQYLARGEWVFAGCRNPSKAPALQELLTRYPARLQVLPLDVIDQLALERAWKAVHTETDGLEIVINNAGINHRSFDAGEPMYHQTLGHLNPESMLNMFQINTLAPLMISQRFLDLLKTGHDAKIANISSLRGSMQQEMRSSSYTYPATKVALNMLSRVLAHDLIHFGIAVTVLHPGWVKTDMGGLEAPVTPAQAVEGMLKVIDSLSLNNTGRFFDWTGAELPW